jgi:hypothetical protein
VLPLRKTATSVAENFLFVTGARGRLLSRDITIFIKRTDKTSATRNASMSDCLTRSASERRGRFEQKLALLSLLQDYHWGPGDCRRLGASCQLHLILEFVSDQLEFLVGSSPRTAIPLTSPRFRHLRDLSFQAAEKLDTGLLPQEVHQIFSYLGCKEGRRSPTNLQHEGRRTLRFRDHRHGCRRRDPRLEAGAERQTDPAA